MDCERDGGLPLALSPPALHRILANIFFDYKQIMNIEISQFDELETFPSPSLASPVWRSSASACSSSAVAPNPPRPWRTTLAPAAPGGCVRFPFSFFP